MFLPTTQEELAALGWDKLDIILVSGDSYIDSPYIGVALIGRLLQRAGYRVGVIAQPEITSGTDIARLGEPRLFWGVTGGSVDSMVANYTATKRKRKSDDYTPGGENSRRPDRAVIVYSNLIRRHIKQTAPIVLGGIEASLRRVAHYDFWSDKVRKSILFDAKADYLVYGMGEKATLELADGLRKGTSADDTPGVCYISGKKPSGYLELAPYEEVAGDKAAFTEMFHTFYRNNDALTAKGLAQKQDTRYLVQNPPAAPLSQRELDELHDFEFERDQHPYYERQGSVRALETIRFSLATHRGCYGECNFCSIAVHQGRTVQWRSENSIVNEARQLARHPAFKGIIHDAGGPTANMYGFECDRKLKHGSCRNKRCLFPQICKDMKVDHKPQLNLLKKLRRLDGIKKVFIASGVRHDLVLADEKRGRSYLESVIANHLSGQMKIAPEHVSNRQLAAMGKPSAESLAKFRKLFDEVSRGTGKKQYLTYYLIAAHPGCTEIEMRDLRAYASRELRINPEQVQIFTPLPSTYSALMYHTEQDPFTGKPMFVEKDTAGRQRQKNIIVPTSPDQRGRVRQRRAK